jgi:hypothetical protein
VADATEASDGRATVRGARPEAAHVSGGVAKRTRHGSWKRGPKRSSAACPL